MIRIVLVGAAGRMGGAVAAAVAETPDTTLAACIDRRPNPGLPCSVWHDSPEAGIEPGCVAIEFSGPEGAVAAARVCAARGVPLVSGATGLDARQEEAVREASSRVAVLRASNFSLGVMALRRAIRAGLAAVPASWDVEILERHHRGKADSPSGTALTLVEEIRATRGTPDAPLRHGREGRVGPRPAGEIGVHAVRGGTWTGDHTVLVAGEGEWLELRHVAQDRSAFAKGAVAAARFVATAAPGLYTLEDLAGTPDGAR